MSLSKFGDWNRRDGFKKSGAFVGPRFLPCEFPKLKLLPDRGKATDSSGREATHAGKSNFPFSQAAKASASM
jgi:hypothetical protein